MKDDKLTTMLVALVYMACQLDDKAKGDLIETARNDIEALIAEARIDALNEVHKTIAKTSIPTKYYQEVSNILIKAKGE